MSMDELRRTLRVRMLERYGALDWGIEAHTGEEYEHSREPQAILLRERNALARFLAFTFAPWSLWELHVGCVPLDASAISLGLHVGKCNYPVFRDDLDALAHAWGVEVRKADRVDEVQCNMPPFDVATRDIDCIAGNVALLCSYAAAAARRAARRSGR